MRYFLFVAVLLCGLFNASAEGGRTITVNDDIYLLQISDNVYVHVSFADFGRFGRVSSNGMVVVCGSDAILVDTPADDEQTEALVRVVEDSLCARTVLLVPTHWHDDCLGGINFIHRYGASSLGLDMTVELAIENNLTPPKETFIGKHTFTFCGREIVMLWPGGGHSLDNIVVWLPEEKILFGGCLIKEIASTNLGNTADGDLEAWPQTLRNLLDLFPDAEIVIPGHGRMGDLGLVHHTLELLSE